MSQDQFSRTRMLVGEEAMAKLKASRVAVFGLGGVGGYAVEALARSGIGHLDLVDDDRVCMTNLNRQVIATWKTVGKYKTDVAEERVKQINPRCEVTLYQTFVDASTIDQFDFSKFDYVIDAVDTVTAKLLIIERCKEADVPVISCMGAGNKMDPTAFRVTDIAKTKVCPLARVMRIELKKRGITKVKVVYSEEEAMTPVVTEDIDCKLHCVCPPGTTRKCTERRAIPGSNAFVPSVAGLIAGGEVVKDLCGINH